MPTLIDVPPYAAEVIEQIMARTSPTQRADMALALAAAAIAVSVRISGFDETAAQISRLLIETEPQP